MYQVSGFRYQVSGIRYQVSSTRYQVSNTMFAVDHHELCEMQTGLPTYRSSYRAIRDHQVNERHIALRGPPGVYATSIGTTLRYMVRQGARQQKHKFMVSPEPNVSCQSNFKRITLNWWPWNSNILQCLAEGACVYTNTHGCICHLAISGNMNAIDVIITKWQMCTMSNMAAQSSEHTLHE